MAELYKLTEPQTPYHRFTADPKMREAIEKSTTLYIGNLSFYTTEEQLYEVFSKCGEIKRIIMGLDRIKKTPCGFCFVEYYTREDAEDCHNWINGTKLDDRIIRTDPDPGFEESRQFGRGTTGGQVRDEYRIDYDPGRGGYGKQALALDPKAAGGTISEDGNVTSYLYPGQGFDSSFGTKLLDPYSRPPNRYAETRTPRKNNYERRSSGSGDRGIKREREESQTPLNEEGRRRRRENEYGSSNPRFREKDSSDEEED